MTPPAKKVIELSLREALQLGHKDIRPEHILLAILRMNEGIPAVALGAGDNQKDIIRDVRGRVIRALVDEKNDKDNVMPICCGQPMMHQEAFNVRRYECRHRPHHPAIWVDMKTKKHLTDDDLPRQDS